MQESSAPVMFIGQVFGFIFDDDPRLVPLHIPDII